MRYSLLLLAGSMLWFSSCNNDTPKTETENTAEAPKLHLPPKSKLDDANTQRLMNVVAAYYELKNGFVASSQADVNIAAGKLFKSAKDLRTFLESDSVNSAAMLPHIDSITKGTDGIVAVTDATTEKKRPPFETVSNGMYALLKAADLQNANIYQQYCPMAFNDKGAYWLSAEVEIRNPYFGKKMLECGEVTDSLK